jgi:uncharacterized protein
MSTPGASTDAARHARRTLFAFAAILLAWTAVWLAKRALDARLDGFDGEAATAAFWFVAKIVVWIVPAYLLVRTTGGDVASAANLPEWRRWLLWGTVVGLLIAVTGVVPKLLAGSPLLPGRLDAALMNVLVVAPLFEEFLVRAALLGNLTPALGFARANVVAAFCFVLLHVPGWAMMGALEAKMLAPIGGALSLFVLGLCFGWAAGKGRSFLGGSVAHFFNNLAA